MLGEVSKARDSGEVGGGRGMPKHHFQDSSVSGATASQELLGYHSLGASQTAMINGKIVFLLLLVATCVALSYAELWMEWRNRAVAVIQLASRTRLLASLPFPK
jgi:hypothetical protein